MKNILCCLLLLAFEGAAAQKIMIADCREGNGCTFTLSEVSKKEAGIALDIPELERSGENDILVFARLKNGKELTYLEKQRSRSALDRLYGGDGYTMIYPFNPRLQPLDGIWQSTIGTVTGTDCYVDIVSMFKRIQGNRMSGTISFVRPFRPYQLFPSSEMKWTQSGLNEYRGFMGFGQGAASPFQLAFTIRIINEERIEGWYDCTIKIPAKGTCKARIPVVLVCTAPKPGQRDRSNEIDVFAPRRKPRVKRLPDDKPTNVDRLPDDNPTQVDRLPDDKPTQVDILPENQPTHIDRIKD